MWLKKMASMLQLCICSVVWAEPVIIFDSGQTQAMQSQPKTLRYQYPPPQNTQHEYNGLPVSTPSMTPGRVQSRIINRPYLNQPIFIVGADPLSIAWLKEHREQLQKHNATGIAVNVQTQQQLEQLRQASGGLAVNPVAGEKIARQLSLSHYPVLVSRTRIEQ